MDKILKKHITTLIASMILCVVFIFGIVFLFHSMAGKTTKVLEIKERIASYQKNKKAFNDEVEKIKILEKRLVDLEAQVINTEKVPSLLSGFETLAQKNNTLLEITSVQTPTEDDKTKLRIEFSVKGSYSQIQSFLNELQHQSFQIKINKLSLDLEQAEQVPETTGTLSIDKTKAPIVVKDKQWQGVATIEILSF